MKKARRWIIMAIVCAMLSQLAPAPQVLAASETEIYDLMTDDRIDPVGLDNPTPVFSWKMRSGIIGQKQTAYKILVKSETETVWDSGKVESDQSLGIVYGGKALQSSTQYSWSVLVWDKDGKEIQSPTASFEMALLEKNAFADTYFIASADDFASAVRYNIDFDFTFDGTAIGFVFGASDEANHMMWQIRGDTAMMRPHICTGGSYALAEESSIADCLGGSGSSVFGKVYHCRIEVSETQIQTWIGQNGGQLKGAGKITHSKNTPIKRLGIRNAGGESGRIDNLCVTDANGAVLYRNTFDSAATNDIVGNGLSVSGGWLLAQSTGGKACLQKVDSYNLPVYRKTVNVEKELASAKLYTAGLGVYESYINGQRVGRKLADGTLQYDELKPGLTQRNRRQFYSTFDVTWMLTTGENVLSGVVTDGWWIGMGKLFPGTQTAYLAKLVLTYTDGTTQVINTDTSWKTAKQAAVQLGTGIFPGERYDATVDQSWLLPGYNDAAWKNAVVNTEFTGELTAWDGVPVIVREDLERTPQSLTVYAGSVGAINGNYGDIAIVDTYSDGEAISLQVGQTLLVDLGQNFAGWEYLELEGERGTVVTVEHGEWLNEEGGIEARGNVGPGGSLMRVSNRGAAAKTVYTMAGGGVEKYHPSFTFYGFRYMEITATAPITVHKVRGQVVTSVHNDAATMETTDKAVNQLLSNIRWGMLSNYLSVPTDCPQRDERQGWTGDSQVFVSAGTYLTFAKSFLSKHLLDMRDAQLEAGGIYTGSYTAMAPYVEDFNSNCFGDAGWADAGIIIPWHLYMMYGDTAIIREHWDSMRTFMDVYMESTKGKGGTNGAGDHMSPEMTDFSLRPFLGVAYYAWDALMMEDMAQAIGDTEAAAHYRAVYEKEKALFQKNYVLPNGKLTRSEQTACLFALYLDLLPDEASVEAVTEQLVSSIKNYGNRMATGFLGTSIICQTLSKIGRDDLAYTLLLQHEYPSWLYTVDQGATTMWERWNSYSAEDGFGPAGSSSFNHYAYGAVASWMYRSLAGIGFDEENPGFKNVILAPAYCEDLPQVKSVYASVYGPIETEVSLANGDWTFRAQIPANTTATARIPVQEGRSLLVNNKTLSRLTLETDGIRFVQMVDGKAEFEAVAGSFVFTDSDVVDIPEANGGGSKLLLWAGLALAALALPIIGGVVILRNKKKKKEQ